MKGTSKFKNGNYYWDKKLYWLSMDKYITDYLNTCVVCRAMVFYQTTEPIGMCKLPWSQVAIDFYGPLPSNEK